MNMYNKTYFNTKKNCFLICHWLFVNVREKWRYVSTRQGILSEMYGCLRF